VTLAGVNQPAQTSRPRHPPTPRAYAARLRRAGARSRVVNQRERDDQRHVDALVQQVAAGSRDDEMPAARASVSGRPSPIAASHSSSSPMHVLTASVSRASASGPLPRVVSSECPPTARMYPVPQGALKSRRDMYSDHPEPLSLHAMPLDTSHAVITLSSPTTACHGPPDAAC
jgi:hypothetical protein